MSTKTEYVLQSREEPYGWTDFAWCKFATLAQATYHYETHLKLDRRLTFRIIRRETTETVITEGGAK